MQYSELSFYTERKILKVRNNAFHKVYIKPFAWAFIIAMSMSCGNALKPDLSDTPTSGNLNVSADESFAPLMTAEAETFMALY